MWRVKTGKEMRGVLSSYLNIQPRVLVCVMEAFSICILKSNYVSIGWTLLVLKELLRILKKKLSLSLLLSILRGKESSGRGLSTFHGIIEFNHHANSKVCWHNSSFDGVTQGYLLKILRLWDCVVLFLYYGVVLSFSKFCWGWSYLVENSQSSHSICSKKNLLRK